MQEYKMFFSELLYGYKNLTKKAFVHFKKTEATNARIKIFNSETPKKAFVNSWHKNPSHKCTNKIDTF